MIAPHAVPQNILDIEFKLFGSLTVKQFSYIAGSLGVGLIFYFTLGALPLLEWPLILASVGLGLMLALVKINERTFDIWLSNYIFAVFTSQRSIYQKSTKRVDVLENLDDEIEKVEKDMKVHIEDSQFQTPTSFGSLPKSNILDLDENSQLSDIDDLFDSLDFGLAPSPKLQNPPAFNPVIPAVDYNAPVFNPVQKPFETFGLDQIKNSVAVPVQNPPSQSVPVSKPVNNSSIYSIKSNANAKVNIHSDQNRDLSMLKYFKNKFALKLEKARFDKASKNTNSNSVQ